MTDTALGICPACSAQPCTCAYTKDPTWLEKINAAVSVFEIAAAAGYRLERTGGYCEGLARVFPVEPHLPALALSCLITARDLPATIPVDPAAPCSLGVYDVAGDLLELHEFPNLAAALLYDPWDIKQ